MTNKDKFKMDIKGWETKVKNVLEVQARVVKEVVEWGLDSLKQETIKNLSGKRFNVEQRKTPEVRAYIRSMRGKLPVNIMFSKLKESIKTINFSTVFGAVYSDHTNANYNRAVHFGYRKTVKSGKKTKTIVVQPRPFLQAAVDARRPAIENKFRYEIMKEIRKAGRA